MTASRPKSKPAFLAPAESSMQPHKPEPSRWQNHLPSLFFADPAANDSPRAVSTPAPDVQNFSDTAAKILEITDNEAAPRKTEPKRAELATPIPEPKASLSATPDFDAEEVKIPVWLEPLARNAAIPAPPDPPHQPP